MTAVDDTTGQDIVNLCMKGIDPLGGWEPEIDVGVDIGSEYTLIQNKRTIDDVVNNSIEIASKKRKSTKCVFDCNNVILFGSFDVACVPKAANKRFLQVLFGAVDQRMRTIFDSDWCLVQDFYKALLDCATFDENGYCVIPQKAIKRIFMSSGERFSKVVQYVRQNTEKNTLSELEINSILGHFSKKTKCLERDFPGFSVSKKKSTVVFILKPVRAGVIRI